MRNMRSLLLLLPLSAFSIGALGACGARTSIPDQRNGSAQGGAGGGEGGAGGTSTVTSTSTGSTTTTSTTTSSTGTGGGVTNPIISETPESLLQAETHVVSGSNGFVVVAWIDVDQQGNSTIGYTFSTNNGSSFGPVQFSKTPLPGQSQASDPVLAVDASNNFYLTWVGYFPPTPQSPDQPTDMHVYVAKAVSGSTSFGAPVEASKPVSKQEIHDKPWIMVDNTGTVIVTYASADQVQTKLHAARSTDGGLTFQHALIAQDQAAFRNLAFPCAPKKGSRIWVTYIAIDTATGGNARVGLSWSDDHGATWVPLPQNTIVSAPNDPVAFDDPNCVAEGDDVWISYGLSNDPPGEGDAAASFALKLAHSGNGGMTISDRIDAHDPAAASLFQHAQITRGASGAIYIAYYAGQFDEDPSGSYRRSTWTGDPEIGFAPSLAVESPVTFIQARSSLQWLGDYTGIFERDGILHMSYVTNANGTSHIAYANSKVP